MVVLLLSLVQSPLPLVNAHADELVDFLLHILGDANSEMNLKDSSALVRLAMRLCPTLWHGIVWNGMVSRSMVSYRIVSYSMIRYCTVWYGVVWYCIFTR